MPSFRRHSNVSTFKKNSLNDNIIQEHVLDGSPSPVKPANAEVLNEKKKLLA